MNNEYPGREELLAEVTQLRRQLAELQAAEIRGQRIEAELRARAHQQAVVAELGQYVLSGADVASLLDKTAAVVAQTLKLEFCQILELLPDLDKLLVRAGLGWREGVIGQVTVDARPDSQLGYTLFSSEPVIVKELALDARFSESALLRDHQIVSGVSVIIDGEQWPFGVLSVHTTNHRTFTQDDIHFLQAVANVLATAIEHKHTQQALQAAHDQLELRVRERTADLQRVNDELRTFAYIVSHDLRAPLVNIKGFAAELHYSLEPVQSALTSLLPHLDQKQQQAVILALHEDIPEALDFIKVSVSRMDNLIGAILKLSRLGRRDLSFEPVEMKPLVQATLETLAHQIEQRRATIITGPLPQVVADKMSMEQIIGNILSNAVNYLEPGRPGQIEIYGEYQHHETIFHVRDNGRGIAPEDMDKIFELFRRAGKQDTPGEGTGLTYVRMLVRRHGGRIWCESEPGVGTTFHFTISNQLGR